MTISSNYAQNSGGGIVLRGTGQVTITNSILWGNDPDQIIADPAISVTLNHTTIQGGWAGSGDHVLDQDPRSSRTDRPRHWERRRLLSAPGFSGD